MEKALVTHLQKVSDSWYLLKMKPRSLKDVKPGQFVYIRLSKTTDPLLRRPLSVHYFDPEDGTMWILFQVAGRGTLMMTEFSAGDIVDYMGPLGNGFETGTSDRKVVLVSGGIGMAPLFFWASCLNSRGTAFDFLVGAATAGVLPGTDYFRKIGIEPQIATEDGSLGYKGLVTGLFEKILNGENKEQKADRIFACGPVPMLSSLIKTAGRFKIPVRVSLEAKMACGVGACLGCICKIRLPGDYNNTDYRRVCKEGPVFSGEEVVFDES